MTEKGFKNIVVNESHNFTGKSVTVPLDLESGVQALICRLSQEDTAVIKMLMFPEDRFDQENAIDQWLVEHPLSNYFVKQLIYTGRWEHPQKKGTFVSVTPKDIKSMFDNVRSYLKMGGSIPVVEPPHPSPDDPVAKMDQTHGDLTAVFQWSDKDLMGLLSLDDVASGWVRQKKVKDVSPSLVTDVHTAHGVFNILFDHICITPDPYLIKQTKFQPLIAQRYSEAMVFYGDNVISYESNKGGNVPKNEVQKALGSFWATLKSIKGIPGDVLGKIKNHLRSVAKAAGEEAPSFEDTREQEEQSMTEEEKKEMERLKTENDELKEKLGTAESEAQTSKEELEQKKKAADRADLEAFKKTVNAMVTDGRIEPQERDQLEAQYEAEKDRRDKVIQYGDTKVSFKDALLAPYLKRPKSSTTKAGLSAEAKKLRTKDGLCFERETAAGRNQLHDHVMNSVSDLEIQNYIRENKLSPYADRDKIRAQLYTQKRDAVLAEASAINE